jgi:hypothetical protein
MPTHVRFARATTCSFRARLARSPDLEGDAYAQTKAALAIIAYRKPFYQVLSLEPHQGSVGATTHRPSPLAL